MSELVTMKVDNDIALLTINRPQELNALNYAVVDRLLNLLDIIELSDDLRAVVITGAGDRAFSAGADIFEFRGSVAQGAGVAIRHFVRRGQSMTARLEAFPKPVIAAVNGLAYGGGCEITEAVHLAISSDRASFGKPEIKLGMPPTFGGTQRLPRLVGRKRGLELLLTGDSFSPEDALEIGLINAIVPHQQLLTSAYDLARRITRHSPLAVTSVITAVTRGINLSIAEGLEVECEQFGRMAPTDDLKEGLNAWCDRRSAKYRGR